MNIKKILLLTIALISVIQLNGQVDFSFSVGKGSYKMETLKYVNSFVMEYLPVEAKIVDSFPMTLFYEGNITYNFKLIQVGISYSYHTTGSRISYNDYSGEIKVDQVISAHTFGPIIKLKVNSKGRVNYFAFMSTNYARSNYSSNDYTRIYEQENSNDISFTANSIVLNPGFEIAYSLKKISVAAFGSYSIDTKGDFKYNREEVLYNGRRFYADWSGIRYGIRIGYKLTQI